MITRQKSHPPSYRSPRASQDCSQDLNFVCAFSGSQTNGDSSKKSSKASHKASKETFQGSPNQGTDGTKSIRVHFVQQSKRDAADVGKPSRNGQIFIFIFLVVFLTSSRLLPQQKS
eukprot:Seg1570.1 transcript_id=Seg1570.1/GoldUCD/mRNA.D3Y31 product="hypothetical protein" protein_id=Seg1570.1/GoldUCD/D3Y31